MVLNILTQWPQTTF